MRNSLDSRPNKQKLRYITFCWFHRIPKNLMDKRVHRFPLRFLISTTIRVTIASPESFPISTPLDPYIVLVAQSTNMKAWVWHTRRFKKVVFPLPKKHDVVLDHYNPIRKLRQVVSLYQIYTCTAICNTCHSHHYNNNWLFFETGWWILDAQILHWLGNIVLLFHQPKITKMMSVTKNRGHNRGFWNKGELLTAVLEDPSESICIVDAASSGVFEFLLAVSESISI